MQHRSQTRQCAIKVGLGGGLGHLKSLPDFREGEGEDNRLVDEFSGSDDGLTSRETVVALADWLYLQTHGHPFFLIEILREGLPALEELLHSGLLCEEYLTESEQEGEEYSFPREVIREVAYQEAGLTRQRLVQRRAWAIMQQEVRNDQSVEAPYTLPVPIEGHPAMEAGSGYGRRIATGAGGRSLREMRWTTAHKPSAHARGYNESGGGEKSLLAAWERGMAIQATSTVPRSPPGSPANDFFETR